MCLVDGEEGDFKLSDEFYGVFAREGLGCHVEQFGAAFEEVFLDFGDLLLVEGRVEEVGHGVGAGGVADGVDLVLHQGDEGRHHDGGAVEDHGRELVAERLATARRHDDKSVVACENAANNLLLVTLEIIEAEDFF